MPSLYVSVFMYSAALSLFWPYLNRQAPVVQKTVEPSPPVAFGSGPSPSLVGSGHFAAQFSGAFWYLTKYVACCAANASSSGVLFTPASVVPTVSTLGGGPGAKRR